MTNTQIWTGGDPVTDIDVAWDNGAAIPGAAEYTPRWAAAAKAFRDELAAAGRAKLAVPYGDAPRRHYDLFLPERAPAGLAVFVHGGYWKAHVIGNWSHFAAGALSRGFAVALPEYTLAPEATIPEITREIGAFLDHIAGEVGGPINLSGHSAGGHLVSRMLCTDAPIAEATAARIGKVVSISGVHDLRCLLPASMNEILGMSLETARAESPALLEPRAGVDLTCIVGGAELAEFRRQNVLLANAWHGFGVKTVALEAPGRHHFDVVDALRDPDSVVVGALTSR
ncbi:alpha/beta hydrolase [Acuticoccus sp. I52.16.1]|uniref:alpha/beta hydrolase n=1 Tax=Acuticoccus sp. I52.16.1 TaxID=2928472 RepID=UPI001FD17A92|nr:alpha/beta hydrolase [Acuticoccus sp. I52.16.1]UOM33981.1 alpha/beta hydrolase [Acuticoccus sp. I52.16.1]